MNKDVLIAFTVSYLVCFLTELICFKKRPTYQVLLIIPTTLLFWWTHNFGVLFLGWSILALIPILSLIHKTKSELLGSGFYILVSFISLLLFSFIAFDLFNHGCLFHSFSDPNVQSVLEKHHFELFVLVMLAAGLFPFHLWTLEIRNILPSQASLFFILGQPALVLITRFYVAFDEHHHTMIRSTLMMICLINAILRSGMGLVRKTPERALWAIFYSQACTLLAAILASHQGHYSAALLAISLNLSFYGIITVVRIMERTVSIRKNSFNLGLAQTMPDLNRLFLPFGLALIGIPGSVAFVGEDLLFHALLEYSSWHTIGFIFATCLNGIIFYKVYSKLFLDAPQIEVGSETLQFKLAAHQNLPLSIIAVVLFILGIMPSLIL